MSCEEYPLNILPDKNVRSETPNGFDCISDKVAFSPLQSLSVPDCAKILARASESDNVGTFDADFPDVCNRSDVFRIRKLYLKLAIACLSISENIPCRKYIRRLPALC